MNITGPELKLIADSLVICFAIYCAAKVSIALFGKDGDIEPEMLRDYFAGQALAGMMANTDDDDIVAHRAGRFKAACAANAYVLADAMLAVREQEGGAA